MCMQFRIYWLHPNLTCNDLCPSRPAWTLSHYKLVPHISFNKTPFIIGSLFRENTYSLYRIRPSILRIVESKINKPSVLCIWIADTTYSKISKVSVVLLNNSWGKNTAIHFNEDLLGSDYLSNENKNKGQLRQLRPFTNLRNLTKDCLLHLPCKLPQNFYNMSFKAQQPVAPAVTFKNSAMHSATNCSFIVLDEFQNENK